MKYIFTLLTLTFLLACGDSIDPADQRVRPIDVASDQREAYRKLAMDGAETFAI